MKKVLYILFLLFIGISCNENAQVENLNYTSVNLPLIQEEQIISLSEIVDSLHYIPLETNDSCLIGNVDKLLVTDNDEYVVVDKELASAVYVFDKKGNFMRQIGHRGIAGKEYVTLEDVSCWKDFLYIWDSSQKKILKFSLDGEFIKDFRFNYSAYAFCCIGEDKFAFSCDYTPNHSLYHDEQYPSLITYEPADEKVEGQLFFDSNISTIGYTSALNNLYHANLYLPLNDTIYKVNTNGEARHKYVLDYSERYKKNKNRYTERTKDEQVSVNEAEKAYLEGMYPHLISYFECDDVEVFFMRMADYVYYGFYYPSSGIYKESASKEILPIEDDIDGVITFSPRCSKGNSIYTVVEPSDLLNKKEILSKGLEEDSNPVLAKLYMKK